MPVAQILFAAWRDLSPLEATRMLGDVKARTTTSFAKPDVAWLINSWPRPGMEAKSVTGDGLLGRFLCGDLKWMYFDVCTGRVISGTTQPLEALQNILSQLVSDAGIPDATAIGYVGYDWGRAALGLPQLDARSDSWQLPSMQFAIYERLTPRAATFRPTDQVPARCYTRSELDALTRRPAVRSCVSKARYLADVCRIKEHIAEGDIYQANYTQAFEIRTLTESEVNAERIFSSLPAPYSTYLRFESVSFRTQGGTDFDLPSVSIISASPERFWRLRGKFIDSRPIKGTIPRIGNDSDDRRQRRRLLSSRKDRAELLMITDLVRNDLGQVSEIGSVKTDALVRIHATPSVWHLESTVSALLADGKSWPDVMRALHPAGSITGTPKRRAVEIIDSLEPIHRGPYCGAIGWINAHGDADFAVGIRTCVQVGNTIRVHGGGGIVDDSEPEAEYYESLIKIAPLIEILATSERETAQASLKTQECN